jgi:hypothetical protein
MTLQITDRLTLNTGFLGRSGLLGRIIFQRSGSAGGPAGHAIPPFNSINQPDRPTLSFPSVMD